MRRVGLPGDPRGVRQSYHRRYHRWCAGGVAFLYFSLLGVPALFFGAGLAVDFTRIIIAGRQVTNAAQAAALSGAQQFQPNSTQIDPSAARSAALETWCVTQASGGIDLTEPGTSAQSCARYTSGRASVTVTPVAASQDTAGTPVYTEVTVEARYRVKGLIFTSFFGQGGTFEADPVTRSAAVCVPGVVAGPTGGYCAHPSR